jgi:putative thioredoxin
MAGAVDLAAVKARSDAAKRAADAPAPQPGELSVDLTEANFQTEVLDRSFQVPVLLLVTSSRAQSSDALVATLETIVAEQNGGLVLGKVNADTDMRVAQALQVRAVPAGYAVLSGQLVPGFEGTPSDAELREFVAAIREAAARAGLAATGQGPDGEDSGPPAPPEDPRFDAAEEALADGNFALARERFQRILDEEPANAAAALGLRESELMERISAAGTPPADPAPDDVAGQLAAADVAFAGSDADGALRRLLDLLPRAAAEDRDEVRRRLIDYFELLGPDDPRVGPARREMARALF